MSKPKYPDKPLSKFKELGITGNIRAKVISMTERFRKNDTAKGKAGSFYKTDIILQDDSGTIQFDRWMTIAELPFKLHDTISVTEVHSVENTWNGITSYELKACSKSEVEVIDKIIDEAIQKANTVSNTTAVTPESKIQIINMPHNPDKIESEFIFYPEFDHPLLRKMHAKEPQGSIRGHIENVILRMQIRDATIENTKATNRVGDLLEAMMKK